MEFMIAEATEKTTVYKRIRGKSLGNSKELENDYLFSYFFYLSQYLATKLSLVFRRENMDTKGFVAISQ